MPSTETQNAILSMKECVISPHDFIYFLKLKEETDLKARFEIERDELIEVEPHHHGMPDIIINYRKHLLMALDFYEERGYWFSIERAIELSNMSNEFISTASENEFFEAIEEFIKKD